MTDEKQNKTVVIQTLAATMDMASFQKLAVLFGPEMTIVVRGRHGIGKSESVYQIAKKIKSDFYRIPKNTEEYHHSFDDGLPVIEIRLSQMSEGDIIGLPTTDGTSTSFRPCDWLITACKRPVVLFLDERNRALEGVKQAVFQLMDSKAFYRHKLHPETRIFVAENIGDQYSVNQVDPAELSRSAVVDLRPTVKDFLTYAEEHCDMALVEYIRSNEKHLEHDGNYEANKKYPDRRAWVRLDKQLKSSGLYDTPESVMFLHMASAMIGPEIGNTFWKFCKERERDVKAIDVLTNAKAVIARLGKDPEASKMIEVTHKLTDWLKENNANEAQAKQLGIFARALPSEAIMLLWSCISSTEANLFTIFPEIKELVRAYTRTKK